MIYSINPVTELHLTADLAEMDVSDGGETWDWECGKCNFEHQEDDSLAVDDMLICDKCGAKYRCE